MGLTDLPLPSRSNVLAEAQDAAVSTSATPFAEPPTKAAPKSKAQKQREYRQRAAASRTPAQAIAARKSDAERMRNYRQRIAATRTPAQAIAARESDAERQRKRKLRKAVNLILVSGSLESTTASSSRSGARSNDIQIGIQQQLTHQQCQTSAAEPAQITVQPGLSTMDIGNEISTVPCMDQIKIKQEIEDDDINFEMIPQIFIKTESDHVEHETLLLEDIYNERFNDDGDVFMLQNDENKQESTPEADNRFQPDEPMTLMDLPLPSRSNVLTGAQDAAASTSATPFAEPPTIAAPKSKAQKQREYRQRIAASRTPAPAIVEMKSDAERQRNCSPWTAADLDLVSTIYIPKSKAQRQREYRQRIAASRTLAQAVAARKTDAERQRNFKLRKVANSILVSGSFESITASSSRSWARSNDIQIGTQQQLTYQQCQTSAAEPAQITIQPGLSTMDIGNEISTVPCMDQIKIKQEIEDDDINFEMIPQIFIKTESDHVEHETLLLEDIYNERFNDDGDVFMLQNDENKQESTPEADNHFQSDESMDLTDLPLTSRSDVLTEAQDSAASTSATPFAEPPTVVAPKSRAQVQREYRQRVAASRTPAQAIAARKLQLERQRKYLLRKAAASTSSTPFAEPPTIAAPKSTAQIQREYRQRLAATRTPAQAMAARKRHAERQRKHKLRKAVNLILVSGSLESTTASSSRSGARSNDIQIGTQQQLIHQQCQTSAAEPAQITIQPGTSSDKIEVQQAQSTWNTKWALSIVRFKSTFLDNDFGYACSVCDRLWFKNDLKPITAAQLKVISEWFIKENRRLCREEYTMVCNSCKRLLNKKSIPSLAKFNGFSYPDQPPGLPPLDPISERLISPFLPFMQVRRLRHDFSYGIIGQVINVPADVQEMVKCLPRQLNEDDVINVNIKRNLAHKSVYISGYMSNSTISAWLTVLQKSPLYRLYEINVDLSRLHPTVPFLDEIQDDPSNRIENISAENAPESEILTSRQHTMMWNEEDCFNIAPEAFNVIYDRHAEELSFPSIYFGEPRRFNVGVSVTPYMIAISEIRRRDRRGATPQKILYVAMKILRLRMMNGIYSAFRNVSVPKDVTRCMLEDTEFLKEYVVPNLTFMKTVPNSVQYWASRKRDLFAIIRQLGKPTILLTMSANEIRWMKLLTILLKLSKKYPGKTAKDLNTSERCILVSDDPVTCCIYFYKLIGSLMKMLKSKQSYNPFGKYFVKDYFLHIQFQHRGSPHAYILLWLNDDPRETVSENMPRTIDLMEKLSSVARDDVPNNSIYANQIHKHTFTCTKRGETTCRFGIPYWPMPMTRVLVPIPQSDGRRQTLQQKAKELHTSLGEHRYTCMDEFLNANGLTYISYLDIVRSTLHRPTLVFRRNFDELMTNTFNPYLAAEVNSNIDIQFILDEYSCAEYVVEYVNKSARGMGNLHCELTTIMQEHPNQDYTGQLKALSIKLLNAVEMSAQEAAWYLLQQPMSETSRQVVYIPTVWPTERQSYRKRRQQMDREGIGGDSTDVWAKNIIQRYEVRPASLEQVYLAEFASWYANANDFVDEEDDVQVDDDEDSEAEPEARTSRAPKEYRRRPLERVIRYRRYDIDETDNYKREMVLLYVQFRNEMSEIVDQNKFLQLFDDNKDTIMERHSLFETNLNIENVMKEL